MTHTNKTLIEALERIDVLEESLLDLAIAICKSASDTVFMQYENPMINITAYDHITSMLGVEIYDDESPLDAVLRAKLALKEQAPRTALTPAAEPGELRERIARIVADNIGPSYDKVHQNKRDWIKSMGKFEGESRDVNGPFRDDYDATTDAILREVQPVGWRDISSAPKDGTDILVHQVITRYGSDEVKSRIVVAHWGCGCWQSGVMFHGSATVTHWMPLPVQPPSTEGGGEDG